MTSRAARAYLRRMAKRGGKARARGLSAERRSAIARKAARARWAKAKHKPAA